MLKGKKLFLSMFLVVFGTTILIGQTRSRIQSVEQKLNLDFGEKQSSYRAANVSYTIEYPHVFHVEKEGPFPSLPIDSLASRDKKSKSSDGQVGNSPFHSFHPDSLAGKDRKSGRPGKEFIGGKPGPGVPFPTMKEKEDDKGMKLYISMYANDIDDDLYATIASGGNLTGDVTYLDNGKEKQVAFLKARLVGVDESYVAGSPDRMLSICLFINEGSLNGHAINLNVPKRPRPPRN